MLITIRALCIFLLWPIWLQATDIQSFSIDMEPLQRSKQVWVYLPPDYQQSDKHYPVLYMLDGQDLFESMPLPALEKYIDAQLAATLQHNERRYANWQIDVQLSRLFYQQKNSGLIVVGLASNDTNRSAEYSPWVWQAVTHPEGQYFSEFIVDQLKPYIDSQYRTLPERRHTGIAGSSIGGLFALYTGLKYQTVFSKIAAFSPVLTPTVFGQALKSHIMQTGKIQPMSIYVDLGTAEPDFGPTEPVQRALAEQGFGLREMWFRNINAARHQIEYWRQRFPVAVLWLYAS